ncbi:unnamed protein product [Rotaria socialis]
MRVQFVLQHFRFSERLEMSRRRLALIFGNDDYGGDKQLNSCVKDARDMVSKLQSVGFTCTQFHNSKKPEMDCAFRDFCSKIKNGDCILIYFSGHGMEQHGKNYLVPIGQVCDPEFDCICLDTMLRKLNRSGDSILNVIILDACRADKDNNTWKTTGANAEECSEPAYGKALTSNVCLPTGSQFALIFSSDPGTVSFGSDAGENSFFTSALLNHLVTPNLILEEVMHRVQKELLERSSKRQRPWLNSCLGEAFYFNRVNIPPNATWKQNGVTIAGRNGDGDATNQLYRPFGLFVDDDQTVVIGDLGNNRIVQWKNGDTTNGQVVAGGQGQGNGLHQLNQPTDVLIDKETDSLIICDRVNKRVVRWSRRSSTTKGEVLIDNIQCYGVAMYEQRYLYVSDEGKHEVRRYQLGKKNATLVAGGNGTVIAGGNGKGDGLNQLNNPYYLFVDRQQTVYVSDNNNHRVMKWDKGAKEGIVVAGGQGAGSALTQLKYPEGIFVDTLGTLYVADSLNHRVMRWTQEGKKKGTVIVGRNGSGARENKFNVPVGLSFDRQGNLYVVDHGNNRVQRFSIE